MLHNAHVVTYYKFTAFLAKMRNNDFRKLFWEQWAYWEEHGWPEAFTRGKD